MYRESIVSIATARTLWQHQIPIMQLPDSLKIVQFVTRLIQTNGLEQVSIIASFPLYMVIQVLHALPAIRQEHTPMQVRNAAPVISRIIWQLQIPAIQPWGSP